MASQDDRSAMAKAMSRVSEIIAICLLMVIPVLIGYWLDQKLSTVVIFSLLGFGLGITGAIVQLIRLVSSIRDGATSDASLKPPYHSDDD